MYCLDLSFNNVSERAAFICEFDNLQMGDYLVFRSFKSENESDTYWDIIETVSSSKLDNVDENPNSPAEDVAMEMIIEWITQSFPNVKFI